jgi:hypothetical protein
MRRDARMPRASSSSGRGATAHRPSGAARSKRHADATPSFPQRHCGSHPTRPLRTTCAPARPAPIAATPRPAAASHVRVRPRAARPLAHRSDGLARLRSAPTAGLGAQPARHVTRADATAICRAVAFIANGSGHGARRLPHAFHRSLPRGESALLSARVRVLLSP